MKKQIKLSESQFKEILRNSIIECTKRINEAEDGGWVVEEYEADEAYNLAAEIWGPEDLNEQIVGCLGKERLAECLAFIFRVNNFKQWTEYQAKKEEDGIHESYETK